MARLGDVGKVVTGNTPKTSDSQNYASNDVCFVKPSDIVDGTVTYLENSEFYVSEYARAKARVLPPKSVLVTCIGIIGKVAINNVECAFNQQINAIIPDESKCLTEYLAYAILNKQAEMQDIANAPVVPILNKTQFSNIEIKLPSLSEQEDIIGKLNAVSKLIALRKEQLAKLDQLVKSRFIELFGDPETNPHKWPSSKLSEFCDLQNGYAFKSQDYLDNSKVLNCRMSNIRPDGGFDAEYHPKYLPDTFWEKYKEYRLVDGDVIIAMTDMASDPKILGVPTIVRTRGHKFLLNQRVGKLSFYDNKSINNVYLMFVLSQKNIRQQLVKSAGGSTQINVGKPAVLGVEFFVPPLVLQNQFAAFVEQTDKSKLAIQQSLDKLETLKKSLMQEYFG